MINVAIVGQGEAYKQCLDQDRRFLVLQTMVDEADDLSLLPGVDLVIIATKPTTHGGLTKFFLKQNKHVLCTGPVSTSLKEVDEIIALSITTNKKVMVDFTYTFSRTLEYAKGLIKIGSIGTLTHIEFMCKKYGSFDGIVWTYLMNALAVYDMFVPLEGCTTQNLKFLGGDLLKVLLNGEVSGFFDLNIMSPNEVESFNFYGTKGIICCDLHTNPTFRYYPALAHGHYVDTYDEFKRTQYCIDYVYQVLTDEAQHNLKLARDVTIAVQGIV